MSSSIDQVRDRITRIFSQISADNQMPDGAFEVALEQVSVLLEELSAAEEELRISNESLLRERLTVERERQRYQNLFDYAPDAYLVTDLKGVIREANRAAADMFSIPQGYLIGKPLSIYIPRHAIGPFYRLLRSSGLERGEISIQLRAGQALTTEYTLVRMQTGAGQADQLRWMLRDVTERNRQRSALAASENRFRAVFESAHIGILLLDRSGRILESNPAFQEITGRTNDKLRTIQLIELLVDEEARANFHEALAALQENSQDSRRLEMGFTRASGEHIWARVTLSTPTKETSELFDAVLMAENITAEKKATDELAELQHRLLGGVELERLRLAQDLHDGPLQDLYAAVYKLSPVIQDDLDEEHVRPVRETQAMLIRIASTLRGICGGLRPPTLQNLGLDKAIRSYTEKVHDQLPNLDVRLILEDGFQSLSHDSRLALFRIYQACVNNVIRHAQASFMEVKLSQEAGHLVLQVWGDGHGFEKPATWVDLVREGHYGLAGIAERVNALGGKLHIDTRPEGGTLVRVTVPL